MENREEERRRLVIEIYKSELQIRNNQKLLETLTEIYLRALKKRFQETEDDLKYLNFTRAETIGEIVKPLSKERFIVKGDDGVRYIVNCCSKVDNSKLVSGTRVTQEQKSLTIMRILPRTINPLVYNMVYQQSDNVSYSDLGGLSKQIKDLRDCIEFPLTKPELFERIGVKPPKGFNGADMRNICTEAGMLALRAERDYVIPNDFIKAVTKIGEAKKLESSSQYNAYF